MPSNNKSKWTALIQAAFPPNATPTWLCTAISARLSAKEQMFSLGWEINSYHSYVPKIQGPSAAVLRMLINSAPYVPIFLQFQSIAFSWDLGSRISFGRLWGKTTGNVHLADPEEEKDQSNMLWFYFSLPSPLWDWLEKVVTAQMTNLIETMPRDTFVIYFFSFIGNSNTG